MTRHDELHGELWFEKDTSAWKGTYLSLLSSLYLLVDPGERALRCRGAKWLKGPNLGERLGMQVRADGALMEFGDVTRCERDQGTEERPNGMIENTEILKRMKLVTGHTVHTIAPAYLSIPSVDPPTFPFLVDYLVSLHPGLDSRAIRSDTQSSGRGQPTHLQRTTTSDADIHAQNFRERRPEATARRNDTM